MPRQTRNLLQAFQKGRLELAQGNLAHSLRVQTAAGARGAKREAGGQPDGGGLPAQKLKQLPPSQQEQIAEAYVRPRLSCLAPAPPRSSVGRRRVGGAPLWGKPPGARAPLTNLSMVLHAPSGR